MAILENLLMIPYNFVLGGLVFYEIQWLSIICLQKPATSYSLAIAVNLNKSLVCWLILLPIGLIRKETQATSGNTLNIFCRKQKQSHNGFKTTILIIALSVADCLHDIQLILVKLATDRT